MRIFPVGQRTFRLAGSKFLTGPVDQRAGFAVHAHDRIRSERCDLAEALQQHIVGHRLHDPGHSGHVELERPDPELLGIAGYLLDLLLGEDLRVKHRIDIAALVHRFSERRQVVEIRVLQAAQENSDRRHAAENRGARFGLGFAFIRSFVADMGMGVENAGQHRPASGVVSLGGWLHEIFAQRDDLAARDSDIRLDLAHAGDNQGSVANEQIERSRVTGFLFHGRAPCPTDDALSAGLDLNAQSSPTSRQQFLRSRRLRDLAAVLEHTALNRLAAQRLVHRGRADDNQVGAAAGGDAVAR
jgi:hypothetical protein